MRINFGRKFIVFTGTDGAGKGTQVGHLANLATESGHGVKVVDFPRYKHPSAWHVGEYLRGNFGTINEVGPKEASIYYAVDRAAARQEIVEALDRGCLVLANRFTESSLAHQGSKIPKKEDRLKFYEWLEDLEFGIHRLPRPDVTLILVVDPEVGRAHANARDSREGKPPDIHQADPNHISSARDCYLELAELYPNRYLLVDCMDGETGQMLTEEQIHRRVVAALSEFFSKK